VRKSGDYWDKIPENSDESGQPAATTGSCHQLPAQQKIE
jgi:hypothetical protein